MDIKLIFINYNFKLLDAILHDGHDTIEAGSYTNPLDPIFNLPISNIKKATINEQEKRASRLLSSY